MNTTRLTNAPKTREQLIAEHADHYDYDALQTPAYNGDGHGHGHDDDEWDPLDYDRADKKLAAYDDALEKAYLASIMAKIEIEDNNQRDSFNDDEEIEEDEDQDQEFEEESNDMLTFDEWQAKMTEDRQERSTEFFKSFDPEDMDYHEWLQEQIELHKGDPEFQYNLEIFTYTGPQIERLNAIDEAAGTESNNAFIRECKAADLEDAEWNKSVIYINKPFAPFTPFTPFTIGNDNNV